MPKKWLFLLLLSLSAPGAAVIYQNRDVQVRAQSPTEIPINLTVTPDLSPIPTGEPGGSITPSPVPTTGQTLTPSPLPTELPSPTESLASPTPGGITVTPTPGPETPATQTSLAVSPTPTSLPTPTSTPKPAAGTVKGPPTAGGAISKVGGSIMAIPIKFINTRVAEEVYRTESLSPKTEDELTALAMILMSLGFAMIRPAFVEKMALRLSGLIKQGANGEVFKTISRLL